MEIADGPSPSAAAYPPSAAVPAAGIASLPDEGLPVPAVSFLVAAPAETAHAVRQHEVEDGQCRWIIADAEAGADALMCGAPQEAHRSFCAAHCALAYLKAPEEEPAEGAEEEVSEKADAEKEEAE